MSLAATSHGSVRLSKSFQPLSWLLTRMLQICHPHKTQNRSWTGGFLGADRKPPMGWIPRPSGGVQVDGGPVSQVRSTAPI